jgi:hypothetical protein
METRLICLSIYNIIYGSGFGVRVGVVGAWTGLILINRAGRVSRVTTRAARIVRFIRLIRLMRVGKLYKTAFEVINQKVSEKY